MTQTTFTVSSEGDLNTAIESIDAGGSNAAANTTYKINVTGEIDLSSDLEAINLLSGSSVNIEGTDSYGYGQYQLVNGEGNQRGFFVYAGSVELENLLIERTVAQGGAGGASDGNYSAGAGGGGAGLGGGLFVRAGASVYLQGDEFISDSAIGGAGGGPIDNDTGRGGGGGAGGGGMGGNGGNGGSAARWKSAPDTSHRVPRSTAGKHFLSRPAAKAPRRWLRAAWRPSRRVESKVAPSSAAAASSS